MASLRKNGLLSSCEPCRRSKLRCDHQFPTCARCVRTSKSDQCIYRPSPTRTANSESATLTPTSTPQPIQDAASVSIRECQSALKRRRLSQCEYLGMTSHFTLFQESTDNLAISLPHEERANVNIQDPISNTIPIESDAVRRGAYILQLLRNLPVYQRITEASIKMTQESGVLSKPVIELTFKSLQEFAGPQSSTDFSALLTRSRQIFGLFSSPIPIHSSISIADFMSSMSCRWEIIGLAFSCLGVATALPGDWDSIVEGKLVGSRKDLGELALSATETCLSFCNEAGVLNDAVSWLISQRLFLATLVHGDRDYRAWRALGDLSTIIFTLGLNQPPCDDENAPFWLVETRKRVMGSAFSSDKQMATFLGRPPRISWRFCDITLPLDLSFDDIIAEPEVRDKAISKLDANGWNTETNDTQAVWLRAYLIMGPVRESILELSLNQQGENLPAKIEELLQQSHQAWTGLPPFLHRPQDYATYGLDFKQSVFLQLHLDYLYDQFLLFRILSKRQNTWSPDLVKVSHEILSEVLLLIESRVRSMRLTHELSWVISFFGLPSAGVLSIELVRRASHQTIDPSDPSNLAQPFSRSRVIQDLSIFASYLRTIVQSHEGNYGICQQARETIGRVLDFILSSETAQPAPLNMNSIVPDPHSPSTTDMANILDYNYYISHLDNWQFELPDTLQMF